MFSSILYLTVLNSYKMVINNVFNLRFHKSIRTCHCRVLLLMASTTIQFPMILIQVLHFWCWLHFLGEQLALDQISLLLLWDIEWICLSWHAPTLYLFQISRLITVLVRAISLIHLNFNFVWFVSVLWIHLLNLELAVEMNLWLSQDWDFSFWSGLDAAHVNDIYACYDLVNIGDISNCAVVFARVLSYMNLGFLGILYLFLLLSLFCLLLLQSRI